MLLNKEVQLAIKHVKNLKRINDWCKLKDICKDIGTTHYFLEQINRSLKIAGIVEVIPGGFGKGTRLLKQNVTVLDIYNAVRGKKVSKNKCEDITIQEVNSLFLKSLENIYVITN